MEAKAVLFALLRRELNEAFRDTQIKEPLAPEVLTAVFSLAQDHDLAHIAAHALKKLGIGQEEPVAKDLDRRQMESVYRYMQLNHEYERICKTLEQRQLPYLPLKGSVIRPLYPQPWMRTSCDIDILVREESLPAAISALTDTLHYTEGAKDLHAVSLYSPGGIHLELHFRLIQETLAINATDRVLCRVWEEAIPAAPGAFRYVMPDALFYFYHIAHMAKHVGSGGCGIRPFMDLWLLNHKLAHDRRAREILLEEGRLLTFAKAAEAVAEVWFSQAPETPLSQQLESYILDGNTYGTVENLASVGQARSGGRFRYYVNRIFMPYGQLKAHYPIIQKHKWLTPLYQLVRWLRILFTGRAKWAVGELSAAGTARDTAELLKQLEIV